MKLNLNEERLNTIKKSLNKFALAGGLSVMLLASSLAGTTINAEAVNDTGVYELNDNKDYLYMENISDLSSLKNIPTLQEVCICNATINGNQCIGNNNISSITLRNCKINNLSNKTFPSSLVCLELDNTKLSNYDVLTSLNKLNNLSIGGNSFDNLNCISKLNGLLTLSLYNCNLGSCKGLENLTNLQNLSFDNVGIEEISEIKNLKELYDVTLKYTCVKDLSPLMNSNVSSLNISGSTNIDANSLTKTVKTMPKLNLLTTKSNEMSITKELYDYVNAKGIDNYLNNDDLEIKNEITSIAKNITNSSMSDNEKIYAVVNYVINHMEYDYSVMSDSGMLNEYNDEALKYALQGKGCCENYAMFTTALLQASGVESYANVGFANGSNHIWNIVEVEGNYYYIDSTWIDEESQSKFNKSPNYMANYENFNDTHDMCTMPSSMYNKLHNTNFVETTTSKTQESIISTNTNNENIENNTIQESSINNDEKLDSKIPNKVKYSGIGIGATVGIALALGGTYAIKKKKDKEQEEIIQKK